MSSTWYPPPSRPRPVEGGIKARSTRGAIAQTWWSERFIAVLEDIGLGNRLQRGRSYARKGQVISLQVDAGLVTALVQGSRARPYRIRIGIPAFGKSQWAHVERTLAENAWYAAKLLSGEMPEDIEDVFAGLGLSLFPGTARELSLDCSCPTTRSHASTWPPPSTCWPSPSTRIRSPSWRGVAASGRICWPTWPLPAPTERHRPPTTPNKWPSRSPTA
ncbi:hypothetical protein RN07_2280 [Mycobacterium tuberculosis variant bovis]|nr:hypothetical protein RN07_2280 [Mycobacterium tuberculosis variant bovis]